jgi:hypothetical protein
MVGRGCYHNWHQFSAECNGRPARNQKNFKIPLTEARERPSSAARAAGGDWASREAGMATPVGCNSSFSYPPHAWETDDAGE